MASLDAYDPNDFLAVSDKAQAIVDAAPNAEEAQRLLAAFQARQWRNKALSDTYEPGSTFKIITLSMALDSGAVSLGDGFYCPRHVSVIGRSSPIRCWKDGGHGSQTLTQAVQHSCNAAFVAIGQRVGAERFYEYCDAFDFLRLSDDPDKNLSTKMGIDFAGEGETVTAQLPATLWQIARDTETILYLSADISSKKEIVPNLAGMRYNVARDVLSRYGIYLHSLSAVWDAECQSVGTQSLQAGSAAAHGSVIEVTLLSSDEELLGKY